VRATAKGSVADGQRHLGSLGPLRHHKSPRTWYVGAAIYKKWSSIARYIEEYKATGSSRFRNRASQEPLLIFRFGVRILYF
jgi:hypothetical protein